MALTGRAQAEDGVIVPKFPSSYLDSIQLFSIRIVKSVTTMEGATMYIITTRFCTSNQTSLTSD